MELNTFLEPSENVDPLSEDNSFCLFVVLLPIPGAFLRENGSDVQVAFDWDDRGSQCGRSMGAAGKGQVTICS